MAGKKVPSAATLHKRAKKRATKQLAIAKKRVQDYQRAGKLVQQVSSTLKKVAASHPNPAARKQAKLALKKLGQAHDAFGSACLCQGNDPTWSLD
jgi:Tat protein secretion system quality control protein TatD with DNase activity